MDFSFKEVIILEGDYTNKDIPYFEGMKSVINPGVNVYSAPIRFGKGGRK